MSDSIIIFKEQKYQFGLFPNDFEHCVPLDQTWISPLGNQTKEWKFENPETGVKGILIHLGSHLNRFPIMFSHKGNVFIKRMEDNTFLGLFSDNVVYQAKIEENDTNLLSRERVDKYPPSIDRESYKGFYKYKRKIAYIIDPIKIFKVNSF
jgi:hypothetical protein